METRESSVGTVLTASSEFFCTFSFTRTTSRTRRFCPLRTVKHNCFTFFSSCLSAPEKSSFLGSFLAGLSPLPSLLVELFTLSFGRSIEWAGGDGEISAQGDMLGAGVLFKSRSFLSASSFSFGCIQLPGKECVRESEIIGEYNHWFLQL